VADICDRCGYLVIQAPDGRWIHDSIADGYLCDLLSLATRTEPAQLQTTDPPDYNPED
jgi:hypothetical protein